MIALIVQLISGAVGGNLAASLMKGGLGTVGNSIAGILGGGLGGQVLGMIVPSLGAAAASGSMDITSILASVAGGGVGGGIIVAIVNFIKKATGSNNS